MWDGQVKVITGIRRSGKSVLLFELFKNYLLQTGVSEEDIIAIALDKRKDIKYRNPIKLYDYVEKQVIDNKKKYYLFIDEIQFCKAVEDSEADGELVTVYDILNELKDHLRFIVIHLVLKNIMKHLAKIREMHLTNICCMAVCHI